LPRRVPRERRGGDAFALALRAGSTKVRWTPRDLAATIDHRGRTQDPPARRRDRADHRNFQSRHRSIFRACPCREQRREQKIEAAARMIFRVVDDPVITAAAIVREAMFADGRDMLAHPPGRVRAGLSIAACRVRTRWSRALHGAADRARRVFRRFLRRHRQAAGKALPRPLKFSRARFTPQRTRSNASMLVRS
jgi:hypothetical protein